MFFFVIACNSSEKTASSCTETGDCLPITYFKWEDSINGEWVVDANGDKVRFETETGYMNFGSTTYTNARIDTGDTNDFFVDEEIYGSVEVVKDINGETIVALVAPDGNYIDVSGTEGKLEIDVSNVQADLFSITTLQSTSLTPENKRVVRSIPLPAANAFVEEVTEVPQTGILWRKQ
jgi:hypothetical protein